MLLHPPGRQSCVRVLIRTSAGPDIGIGHFMRCLALAEACIEAGGAVTLLTDINMENLVHRADAAGILTQALKSDPGSSADAAETLRLAVEQNVDWIVLDDYRFSSDYQAQIRVEPKIRLLVLDDYGQADHYYAHTILNQNAEPDTAIYRSREKETELLLGPRFALLRSEFRNAPELDSFELHTKDNPPTAKETKRVLITAGGSNPGGITQEILVDLASGFTGNLAGLKSIAATVVVGEASSDYDSVADLCSKMPFPTEVLAHPGDMPALMRVSDVAISGAGSTTLELAALAVPTIAIVLAPNQEPLARGLEEHHAAVIIRDPQAKEPSRISAALSRLLSDRSELDALSRNSRALVDGQGAPRVIRHMAERLLNIRDATMADADTLLEWANDAETRNASFNQAAVEKEAHYRWLAAKLSDRNVRLFILTSPDGDDIAQVRFETAGDETIISLSLASQARGKGLGPAVVSKAIHHMTSSGSITEPIVAYIKSENTRSLRTFLGCGFYHESSLLVDGNRAERLVYSKRDMN